MRRHLNLHSMLIYGNISVKTFLFLRSIIKGHTEQLVVNVAIKIIL